MDKRKQKYFRKQKIFGIVTILLAVISAIILNGDITIAMFLVPLGLYTVFTKEMVFVDEYFFEMNDVNKDEEL